MTGRAARRSYAVLLVVMALVCAGCAKATPKAELSYRPPFVPVRFSIDTRGHVSVTWDRRAELVTPLGEFSVTGGVDVTRRHKDGLKVVIHDGRKPADRSDTVYLIGSNDELDVVIDGRTHVTVGRDRVVIDVTDGTVHTIDVRAPGAPPAAPPPSPKPTPRPTPREGLPIVTPDGPDIGVTYHCTCDGPRGQEMWKVLLGLRNRTSRTLPIGTGGATPLRLLVADVSGEWTPPSGTTSRPATVRMPDGTRATAIPPNAPHRYEDVDGYITFATVWRQPASLAPGRETDCSYLDTGAGPRNRCDLVFYVPTGARTRVLGIGYVAVSPGRAQVLTWLPLGRWGEERSPIDF